ncbi:20379_t:CDS:2, partial [Cetraspora pellucida]
KIRLETFTYDKSVEHMDYRKVLIDSINNDFPKKRTTSKGKTVGNVYDYLEREICKPEEKSEKTTCQVRFEEDISHKDNVVDNIGKKDSIIT